MGKAAKISIKEHEDFIHIIYNYPEGKFRVFVDEIWRNGKKIAEKIGKVRVYPRKVIENILRSLGFEILYEFEGWSIRKFREGHCTYLCFLKKLYKR